jgi:hypothetical protein
MRYSPGVSSYRSTDIYDLGRTLHGKEGFSALAMEPDLFVVDKAGRSKTVRTSGPSQIFPKSMVVPFTLECVVFPEDGVARSVVKRMFKDAVDHHDDSGSTRALSPSDRAILP